MNTTDNGESLVQKLNNLSRDEFTKKTLSRMKADRPWEHEVAA
jgi:hypothetical protein